MYAGVYDHPHTCIIYGSFIVFHKYVLYELFFIHHCIDYMFVCDCSTLYQLPGGRLTIAERAYEQVCRDMRLGWTPGGGGKESVCTCVCVCETDGCVCNNKKKKSVVVGHVSLWTVFFLFSVFSRSTTLGGLWRVPAPGTLKPFTGTVRTHTGWFIAHVVRPRNVCTFSLGSDFEFFRVFNHTEYYTPNVVPATSRLTRGPPLRVGSVRLGLRSFRDL